MISVAEFKEGLLMLDERGPIWETVRRAAAALDRAEIPYCVAGGLAVFTHGYRRNTDDVDILVQSEDQRRILDALTRAGLPWSPSRREFVGPGDTPIHLLFAGERVRGTEYDNPAPVRQNVSRLGGMTVIRLARLVEIKLAVGLSNPRRSYQDLADVVELIARNRLTKAFAAKLHRSLRREFRRLVDVARSPG